MDYQTKCFFDFVFGLLLLAAIVAFFWWAASEFVDATKDLAISIAEKQQAKATCFDNGYTKLKWANGEYYCINEATGNIISVERLKE